ncbi:WD40 repeat domain-containing protein [Candidatus Bathyarchaeota archaeon]|nr:MAG: WD40 repeat domain-containing protein [Candidatus Bathyarchaeota archaeon]
MRALLVVLYCTLALAIFPFPQVAQVSGNSSQLPFDSSKPYALVVGDGGRLFVFDGHQLFPFPTHTSFDLTQVRWRRDGAYALAVGDNSTLLKISLSNGAVSVETIPIPLHNATLESITWKPDDSSALIAGPGGNFLVFDGQKVTLVRSGITKPIFASGWSPTQNIALVVGQSGLIAEFNGTTTHIVDPSPTNYSFFGVGWNPSGSYALVGGDHAKLFKYQQGSFTEQNTAVLFEVAPHLIRAVAFNQDNGMGLLSGQLGLTVIATQSRCDYNIFNNANTICLSYKRIQYYTDLNGTKVDLHRIGHFYGASWMPGTQEAYAVGTALDGCLEPRCVRGWTLARITSSDVTLLLQDRKSDYSLRSIDWQPTVRASNPQMFTWYLIASGTVGLAAIVMVTKRKTLKEWLGHSTLSTSRRPPQNRT